MLGDGLRIERGGKVGEDGGVRDICKGSEGGNDDLGRTGVWRDVGQDGGQRVCCLERCQKRRPSYGFSRLDTQSCTPPR
jgi:hypothetical protein